jgi:hypothetical protein
MKKSKIIIGAVFVSVIILGISAFILIQKNANNPLADLQYDKDAYQVLCKADTFSYSGVGYSGTMSQETEAYTKLYKSKDAKKVFKCLEKDANIQGKMYALCAFYYLDNAYYQKQVQMYMKSNENVNLMSGCIGYGDSVSKIMKSSNSKDSEDFYSGAIPKWLNYYITSEPVSY